MSEPSKRVLDLARALADSDPVDWTEMENEAEDDEERELVRIMRVIGEHAEVHRTRPKAHREQAEQTEKRLSNWGHLEIFDVVGEGASAEVFRARDRHLNRNVALKLFRSGHPMSRESKKLLMEEGKNLASVRHENVVTVHGADEHDGRIGIWMELVEGRTLNQIVSEQGPFSAREASLIAIELCRALAAVHKQGLVHGDVKAQNVKREAGGRIVLMDFSTSRGSDETSRRPRSDPGGTPLYMAPELWKGVRHSAESDIYALGVLLFYLVTGEFPVRARSMIELEMAHRKGERRLLRDERPGLPETFVRTVEKALNAIPADRFRSAGAFEQALIGQDDGAEPQAAGAMPREVRILAGVARAAALVLGVAGVLTVLGFVTSAASNVTLGRPSEFVSESVGDWLLYGLRSMVFPIAFMTVVAVPIAILEFLGHVFRKSPGRRFVPENMELVTQGLVVTGALVLGLIFWAHMDFISAVTSLVGPEIDSKKMESLGDNTAYFYFRMFLSIFVLVSSYAFFKALRVAKEKQIAVGRAVKVSMGVVILAALFLMTFSWHFMSHSEFERVEFAGERAYIIGERESEVLLFCPASQGPKNRVVAANDERMKRLGWVESIFVPPEKP